MHDGFSKEQKTKIEKFIDLAVEFNKTHNIFSRNKERDIYIKDILDCAPLTRHIKTNQTVLDLGSGGGFPGILLAITRPNNKVCLVESSKKKCYFLKKTKEDLCLTNIKIINKTINKKNTLGVFDVITARAFANTKKILDITKQNTHPKTKYLLLKGKKTTINKELKDIDNKTYKCEIIKQDSKGFERNIVSIKINE